MKDVLYVLYTFYPVKNKYLLAGIENKSRKSKLTVGSI
jgi:hypothetical protein